MNKFLVLVAGVFAAGLVNAGECIKPEVPANPLWTCDLSFTAIGEGAQIIGTGEYTLEGEGIIKCAGQNGFAELPVTIVMQAAPLSVNISAGEIELDGEANSIPLYTLSPEALVGEYGVAQTNLAIGMGFGSFSGTKLDGSDITIPFSLRLIKGLGFNFGITNMSIQHATH